MATNGPLRRRIDERPAAAAVTVPTPEAEPVNGVTLNELLDAVLDSAHEARRSVTFVIVEARGFGNGADLGEVIRPIVREDDVLWRTGSRSLAMVLVDADGPSGDSAVSRIRDRVRATTRLGVAMGRATAAPGIAANDLVNLARANLLGIHS